MQVDILGPVRVRDGDDAIDLGGPRSRALVARLALEPGRAVGVDGLVDALWGADVPSDAHNALQSVVSRTRRRLPDGVLRSGAGGYALDLPADAVDAHRFERLVREGRPHDALALWRGEALGDVRGAAFADIAAARLDELRLGAVESRIERDLEAGRIDRGRLTAEAEELAAAHPYRETIWALLMRTLVADGRQADALGAYERMRAGLADELGIDPSAGLQDLHLAILRGDPALTMPGTGKPVAPTNLRTALTSFVGRADAVDQIRALLGEHRLVTLVGPGGAGKTRLASETVRAMDVPDGAWIVELASVTDPSDILGAFVSALGLREVVVLERSPTAPRPDPRERLLESLRDKSTLFLVDNCEHLVGGVAEVVDDLLARVPGLRVLATSREPLALTGEALCPVAALDRPPADCTPSEALGFSAVRLFVDRAQAAVPTFALDAHTLPAVLEVCERLDGLPLAIELAAARLRVLGVDQIAARLGDRFRLLTGGSRTALPRHRTLHAVVEWSWDLLTDAERRLAARIAVFPAGVTVESAAAVVGAEDPYDVLDTLTALADKSLLVPVHPDGGGAPRFRMLETLREFGSERLVENDELAEVRGAHLGYFLGVAERAEPLLRGPEQLGALATLDVEQDNILAALRFAVSRGDGESSSRMVAALAWYWSLRSQHREASAWAETVLAVPGPRPPEAEVICVALTVIGMLGSTGRDEKLRNMGERIDRFMEQIGDHRPPVVALVGAASAMFSNLYEDPDHAEEIDPAEVIERFAPPDPWARAAIRFMVTAGLENQGNGAAVDPLLEESLAEFRSVGDRWGMAMCLGQLGTRRSLEGDPSAARAVMEEAISLLVGLGADDDALQLRSRMAWMALGDDLDDSGLRRARSDLIQMHEDAQRRGSSDNAAVTAMSLAEIERQLGNSAEAREMADRVRRRLPEALGGPQVNALLYLSMAYSDLHDGFVDAAEESLVLAATHARRARDMPVAAAVAVGFAGLALASGDEVLAAERLGAAVSIRGEEDLGNRDAKRLAGDVRGTLGATAYTQAFERGRTLPRRDALDLACPVPDDDADPQRPADRWP